MKYTITIILIILSFKVITIAQIDTTNLIKYDYGFTFKEGIYLNFESFSNNKPIPFESLIQPQYPNNNFFDQLDTIEQIIYNGPYGNSESVLKTDTWGYCKNGKPYIQWADKFNLIPYVGKISHFITTIKVYYSGYQDPFYDPYGYNPATKMYHNDELRQFILDMDSGEILDYNLKNVESIIKRDPVIFKEFTKLRKRKRTKEMFYYIGLYNKNNPLYFTK